MKKSNQAKQQKSSRENAQKAWIRDVVDQVKRERDRVARNKIEK